MQPERHGHPIQERQDDPFLIDHNYRSRMKVARSRGIRQMRREEAHPNGRKASKRIRKYQPVYKYNHYHPDQPWDVLAIQPQHPPEEVQDDSNEESIGVEKGLPLSESTAEFKQPQFMSRETICQPKSTYISLFVQAFPIFEWPNQQ